MGLRCRYCKRIWPNKPDYENCPVCQEPTAYTQQDPMPDDEALVAKAHGDFGWWLYHNDRL